MSVEIPIIIKDYECTQCTRIERYEENKCPYDPFVCSKCRSKNSVRSIDQRGVLLAQQNLDNELLKQLEAEARIMAELKTKNIRYGQVKIDGKWIEMPLEFERTLIMSNPDIDTVAKTINCDELVADLKEFLGQAPETELRLVAVPKYLVE